MRPKLLPQKPLRRMAHRALLLGAFSGRVALFGAVALLGLTACGRWKRADTVSLPSDRAHELSRVIKPAGTPSHEPGDTGFVARTENLNASYYYLLGKELSANEDSANAIVAFERAKSLDPESSHLHLVLAEEYLKAGRLKEGVALTRKAIEIEPKNREARLLLANFHSIAKKTADAQAIYLGLLKDFPQDEEILLYVVINEIEAKNYASVQKRLATYLHDTPDSALGHYYLGRVQQETGQNKAAIASYERAIDLRAGFVQAGTYLAYMYELTAQKAKALETYTWLADETDGAAFHQRLGQMYLDKNDFGAALSALQNLERVDPSDLNNRVKIGLLLVETKQLEKAAQQFEKILSLQPDSDQIRYYYGAVLEELGRHPQARDQYAKIGPANRLYWDGVRRRATSLATEGKTDQGWSVFKEALDRFQDIKFTDAQSARDVAESLYEGAVLYLANAKRTPEAWTLLNQAEGRFPQNEIFTYLKGSLFEKEGKFDDAVTTMLQILKANPLHAGALNFVGYMYAEKNVKLPEAESMIRKALKLKPSDPFIQDSLGWVLFRRGKLQEAHKVLQEAFEKSPKESVIAEHLGDVLVKLGQLEEAKKYYETALQLGPDKDSERQKLEAKLADLKATFRSSSCGAGARDCTPDTAAGLTDALHGAAGDGVREPSRDPASDSHHD